MKNLLRTVVAATALTIGFGIASAAPSSAAPVGPDPNCSEKHLGNNFWVDADEEGQLPRITTCDLP